MGWHRLEGTQAMVTDAPAVKATGGVDGWAASQMALRDEWQARVSALRKLERVSRNLARLRNLAQRVRLPAGLTAEVVADCSGCLRRSAARQRYVNLAGRTADGGLVASRQIFESTWQRHLAQRAIAESLAPATG